MLTVIQGDKRDGFKRMEFSPPPRPSREKIESLKVTLREACNPESLGSMGAQYIANSLESAGYKVGNYDKPDVELVSVHHCTDYPRVAAMPRKGRVRIIGGHPMSNNPRPIIPFADAVCVGEGEEWIVWALDILADGGTPQDLGALPGTIISRSHQPGDPIPKGLSVSPLPKHPAYLNRSGKGHARVWYLEMARGCPFTCTYCELGWAWKYRPQDTQFLLDQIDGIDASLSPKISLFAPDEASHPDYDKVLDAIHAKGLRTSFGSMRLDQLLARDKAGRPLPLKRNMLIRVGLDGLSEETRKRVRKPLPDDLIWEYFRYMTLRRHVNFKIFMVFGYPWETLDDLEKWKLLWSRIQRIPIKTNVHVRIKFTPLIPQPATPLGDVVAQYDYEMVYAIKDWMDSVKSGPDPWWYVRNDGLMAERTHAEQIELTHGDEGLLLRKQKWSCLNKGLQGYDVWDA